jgi:hypothetical protein
MKINERKRKQLLVEDGQEKWFTNKIYRFNDRFITYGFFSMREIILFFKSLEPRIKNKHNLDKIWGIDSNRISRILSRKELYIFKSIFFLNFKKYSKKKKKKTMKINQLHFLFIVREIR